MADNKLGISVKVNSDFTTTVTRQATPEKPPAVSQAFDVGSNECVINSRSYGNRACGNAPGSFESSCPGPHGYGPYSMQKPQLNPG